MHRLHRLERQVGQVAAARLGRAHEAAGDVVCLAEGQAQPAHEPVGQIGRGREPRPRRRRQRVAVGLHVAHHPRHRRECEHQAVGGVEDLFLVLLHVLGIGEREALHHRHQPDRGAEDPPDLGADQLGRVGVLLLRHDRGAGGEAVREPHEAELRRGPDHELLGEARQVHRADRGGAEEFEREIAVRDRIEAVGGGPVEAERRRRGVAIDRKRGAGERRRPEGAFVHPRARIGKPAAVAREHLDIGHHVVAPCHRLGRLQVGEARHDPIRPGLGLIEEGRHQRADPLNGRVALAAHPEAEIDRDLIVARARGVQPPGRGADQLGQPRLDVHVDVLELHPEGEGAGRYL